MMVIVVEDIPHAEVDILEAAMGVNENILQKDTAVDEIVMNQEAEVVEEVLQEELQDLVVVIDILVRIDMVVVKEWKGATVTVNDMKEVDMKKDSKKKKKP